MSFRNSENPRFRIAALATLIATGILLLTGLGGSAIAGPVNKDGKIYACYKVKGQPRGAMRVLFKGKRCKRGERRVAWIADGPSVDNQRAGGAGADGQSGSGGQAGEAGASGSTLSTEVAGLALRIDGLEGVLQGVENKELSTALSTVKGLSGVQLKEAVDAVDGITNAKLLEAVEAAPLVDEVCGQVSTLTSQSNLLGEELDSLVGILDGVVLLGEIFGVLDVPEALDPFACATP